MILLRPSSLQRSSVPCLPPVKPTIQKRKSSTVFCRISATGIQRLSRWRKCILSNERMGADYGADRYDNLHERIKYVFANCTHPDIMTSVSNLFQDRDASRECTEHPLAGVVVYAEHGREDENHRRTIGELEDLGISELAYTFSFIQPSRNRGNILMWVKQLVDKMIE